MFSYNPLLRGHLTPKYIAQSKPSGILYKIPHCAFGRSVKYLAQRVGSQATLQARNERMRCERTSRALFQFLNPFSARQM